MKTMSRHGQVPLSLICENFERDEWRKINSACYFLFLSNHFYRRINVCNRLQSSIIIHDKYGSIFISKREKEGKTAREGDRKWMKGERESKVARVKEKE